MFELINQFIFHEPFIITIIVAYFIRNNIPYLQAFVFGTFVNIFLNKLLKLVFRQNRPSNIKHDIYMSYTGAEQYGMPSGHMQITFFAITYYYLLKRPPIHTLILLLFLAGIVFYQRYSSHNHTIEQLLVGSAVGGIFAYILFDGTERYLSKKDFN